MIEESYATTLRHAVDREATAVLSGPLAGSKRYHDARLRELRARLEQVEIEDSLLPMPLTDRDRGQLRDYVRDCMRNRGDDPERVDAMSDWALREEMESELDPEDLLVLEADWAYTVEDGIVNSDEPYDTARRNGVWCVLLDHAGPGGGNPVFLFWGAAEVMRGDDVVGGLVPLMNEAGYDPQADYSPGRPACRFCGWSQVGSVPQSRKTCPSCGQEFDWV